MRLLRILTLGALVAGCLPDPPPFDPTQPHKYKVLGGDTWESIASKRECEVEELKRWNGLADDHQLMPGEYLMIYPDGVGAPEVEDPPDTDEPEEQRPTEPAAPPKARPVDHEPVEKQPVKEAPPPVDPMAAVMAGRERADGESPEAQPDPASEPEPRFPDLVSDLPPADVKSPP